MGALVGLDVGRIADDVLRGIEHYLPSESDKHNADLAREQARAAIVEALNAPIARANLGQLKISEREAASGSLFLDGWHAAIGWAGAGALIYEAVGVSILGAAGVHVAPANMSDLVTILQYMLGLGGMGMVHANVRAMIAR